MKEDLRMNAKSPDPDDLARGDLPQTSAAESPEDEARHQSRWAERSQPDRSAPHIPPLEKGRIKSNE